MKQSQEIRMCENCQDRRALPHPHPNTNKWDFVYTLF